MTFVTVHGSSNIYMLYMSCLRMTFMKSCEVSADEISVLLPALTREQILNFAVRDINWELELYERMDYSEDPRYVLLSETAHDLELQAAKQPTEPVDEVQVPRELWQRIIRVASRYAIGSMTYVVSWQAGIIETSFRSGDLDDATAQWICRYITERDDAGQKLGASFDRARWLTLRDSLTTALKLSS